MQNAGLDEAQAGIKIARRNINHLIYADDTTLMAENEEKLKSLSMKVKEESEKAGLKLSIQNLRSWHLVPSLHSKQMGKQWKQWQTLFSWASKSLWTVTVAMKFLKRKAITNLDSILKSRDIIFPTKVHIVKAMVLPVWMWQLDHKEDWALKNWCFWTVVLEKTLENPLDCKEIQPVNSKVNQSWIFTGRTDSKAEALILWPPDAKS